MPEVSGITLEVTAGDTRPICEWTILDDTNVPIDLTSSAKTATLYYGPKTNEDTDWKLELSKVSPATEGNVQYVPSEECPYLPTGRSYNSRFSGDLLYTDTEADPPIEVWFHDILIVRVGRRKNEP